jgi:hypothetical protein
MQRVEPRRERLAISSTFTLVWELARRCRRLPAAARAARQWTRGRQGLTRVHLRTEVHSTAIMMY